MAIDSTSYVLCIENKSCPASLEVRKVYRALSDPEGERHGSTRVIDESGEGYLYPRRYFVSIELPEDARRCFGNNFPRAAR